MRQFLKKRYIFPLIFLCLCIFQFEKSEIISQTKKINSGIIYLAPFTSFKSPENSIISNKIYSSLEKRLSHLGFRVVNSKGKNLNLNLQDAKEAKAIFYVEGLYKKTSQSENLNLYGQIYNPETGFLIDAINVEEDLGSTEEGIVLDKQEMQIPDDTSISEFTTKLSDRLRTNSKRAVKSENIDEYVIGSPIGQVKNFPIQKENIESDIADVFKIFEETEVVTASKKAQKVSEAPASIVVITDKEIQKKGYNTILDILRDVAMIDINSPGQGYLLDIGGRGINSNLNMGKYWQILIDGHDMTWRQFYRNYLSPAWLSVDNIKRIEIVKGPNSALWGANAVLGVMNIITKDNKDVGDGQISALGGSNSTLGGNITGSKTFAETGQIYSTLSYYNENVPRKIKEWSDVKGRDVYNTGNDSKYVNSYTKIKYKDFMLNTMFSQDNGRKGISQYSVGGNTLFQINKYYADLLWEKKVTERLELRSSIYYDQTEWGKDARYEDNPYNGPITDPAKPAKNKLGTQRFIQPMKGADKISGFRFLANYDILRNMSIIAGGNYEYRYTTLWYFPETIGNNYSDVPKFNTFQHGTYAQWSYTPHKMININAGIRYDFDSIFHSKNSPRAGLILKPKDNVVIKMMYGEAYKAPSIFELYYARANSTFGNPNLKPESNKTYESQIIYTPFNWLVSKFTVYSILISDIIYYQVRDRREKLYGESSFKVNDRPTGTFDYRQQANSTNDYRSKGGEVEFDLRPMKNLTISFNGSFRWMDEVKSELAYKANLAQVFLTKTKQYDDDTMKRSSTLNYAAKTQYSSSVSYTFKDNYTFTLIGRYVSDKGVPSTTNTANLSKIGSPGYLPIDTTPGEPGYYYNNPIDTTIKAPSYYLLNFVFYWSNITENLDLMVRIDNLMNKEYYDAGALAAGTGTFDVLYNQPGRSIYFKIHFKSF